MKREIKFRSSSKTITTEVGSLKGAIELNKTNLSAANLSRAKNYVDNHEFCAEIIRQNLAKFTQKEKAVFLEIYLNRFCWDKIPKYGVVALSATKKLAELGYGEWLKKLKEGRGANQKLRIQGH